MTDHRDFGDENDSFRHPRGETVRNIVYRKYEERGLPSCVECVNVLLDWCENKDIKPMKFGWETIELEGLFGVWVKGVQR